MSAHSTFIQSDELGQLHVLEVGEGSIVGVSADAIGGSALAEDTYGIAHTTANLLGGRVLTFDRPGTGHSTIPEDRSLRSDMLRHGYKGVSSAVCDVLQAQYGSDLERATYIGHSLGGYAAALAGFEIGAKEVITLDSGGWSHASLLEACVRYAYGTYLEARYGKQRGSTHSAELDQMKRDIGAVPHKGGNFKNGTLPIYEIRSIFELARPGAMNAMKEALRKQRVERVKIGFCQQTFNLNDQRRVAINRVTEDFNNTPRRIGVVSGGPMGTYHREAALPSAVSFMLLNSAEVMTDRL